MERISIIENFVPKNDEALLRTAEKHRPALRHKRVAPVAAQVQRADGTTETVSPETIPPLGAGESVCYDFGNHFVGYVTLQLSFAGSHPDAPAYLELQFAERESELHEDAEAYHGWISKSWIQRELVHIDKLPYTLVLPRRYALRYCRVRVIDTSRKYRVLPQSLTLRAVGTADPDRIAPLETDDERLRRIDKIGVRTLANCMQEVFEDGPKRDRRLWLGDFRLQALADYVTFRQLDIVRRCLYLFAGTRFPDDRIAACLFTDGEATADDTWFPDYALFFPVALEEYVRETHDRNVLCDLYPIACKQIEITLSMCENDVVNETLAETAFIDWCPGLDKTACMQGVLIYALRSGIELAHRMDDREREGRYIGCLIRKIIAARRRFWDEQRGVFVSNGQVSTASQVWMVLAGVLRREQAAALLASFPIDGTDYRMVSPYMHHYYVAALLDAGLTEQAKAHLLYYWGGMADAGADTFWEIYDPADPNASPYGGTIVNSYCHAWSCTPVWFLRSGRIAPKAQ